jgi:hypothetical protein
MTNFEPVDIVIGLSSTFWKDPPKSKVYIDDNLIFDGHVDEPKEIKWVGNLTEDKHKIIVELYDKDKYQTVLEDGKIVKDQILNIDLIMFDEIDIGYLRHTLSVYYADRKDNIIAKDCVNLGLNGRWELEFTTPVYIWLLENI